MSSDRVLTPRQIEFLVCAANGMQYQEIAEECCVYPSTVKSTLRDARERLDARTTGQAIIRAISYELIAVDGMGTAVIASHLHLS